MQTFTYVAKGHLVDAIADENVGLAQEYLTQTDMTQFVDEDLRKDAVVKIEWKLAANGYDYKVEMLSLRELTADELKRLSDWVSGQNSDGLGEGFEQQEWAWIQGESFDVDEEDEEYEEDGHMASFDWKTNPIAWELVPAGR